MQILVIGKIAAYFSVAWQLFEGGGRMASRALAGKRGGLMRREIRVDGLSEPISHYTDAVQYGDLLFISGVAPFDENSQLVGPDDPVAQTRQIFKNWRRS